MHAFQFKFGQRVAIKLLLANISLTFKVAEIIIIMIIIVIMLLLLILLLKAVELVKITHANGQSFHFAP